MINESDDRREVNNILRKEEKKRMEGLKYWGRVMRL
jgi:hypothetical protein